ncbi:MAG: chlorophyll synthase ChlG [Alphaproteobacteria bacterium]|nr:chlorophyll synthase ChlG [Alphaproteobacteria bacterium]
MAEPSARPGAAGRPLFTAVLELLKPITWFAPMWAYGCGVVSSGRSVLDEPAGAVLGVLLAGPLVCATSQAVNDWFDRHVDAINEPHRPIPSGRLPGRSGLHVAIAWTALSLAVGALLGPWGFGATIAGLTLAWAYSAPPFRLKRDGWIGNAAVAVCYEGLPWITGAAVMGVAMPDARILILAALYSFGAHGIMTLNDFKSVDGDRKMGVRSLPVRLGVEAAARVACAFMFAPQVLVIAALWHWDSRVAASCVAVLLAAQVVLMARLLRQPRERAPWYNATGTTLYVLGMLASAIAIGQAA